jgi:hypothetical protein
VVAVTLPVEPSSAGTGAPGDDSALATAASVESGAGTTAGTGESGDDSAGTATSVEADAIGATAAAPARVASLAEGRSGE